ncbi:MAG TPA: hypothetical protein ENG87_04455, partial [Candidatus Pacearchaeota archaeon]|nr:hypothetical protein [Candidatus Pacearchaeota archaeon]
MRKDDISEVLESIGLSKNEVIVYLDLIRVGKSSVIDISKRTGLYRSNTYDILEKLLKKGFVDQSIENEKKFFYPIDPNDLLDYIKHKEQELKEIIPEIEKIQNKPQEERKVTLSEGVNSVKNIIMNQLECQEPIYVYGSSKEPVQVLGEAFLNEFHKERTKKKIFLKRLHSIGSIKRARELNALEYTEARYLPLSSLKISINVCGRKVIIIVWDMPVSAIVIESSAIAESYRNNFELL